MNVPTPDWIYLPPEISPISLWHILHDARLQKIVSDRLARTLTLSFEIYHATKFHKLPDETQYIFRFEAVTSVRAETFLGWPQKYVSSPNATREEQNQAIKEYSDKGREQSISWDALEQILDDEDRHIDIINPELVQVDGRVGLRLYGFLDGDEEHELFVRAASLVISDTNGRIYDFPEFLALGAQYWEAFGKKSVDRSEGTSG